jgi:MerR family glutamine synthetase transcriptional repressor
MSENLTSVDIVYDITYNDTGREVEPMDDQLRRSMALFSMSIVQKLTGLSARQIRYYEEQHLIHPERTEGNRRVFSFIDVEKLLEIKALLDKGVNLAGVKHVLQLNTVASETVQPPVAATPKKELSEADLMKHLKTELMFAGKYGRTSMIQGELSRFFH